MSSLRRLRTLGIIALACSALAGCADGIVSDVRQLNQRVRALEEMMRSEQSSRSQASNRYGDYINDLNNRIRELEAKVDRRTRYLGEDGSTIVRGR